MSTLHQPDPSRKSLTPHDVVGTGDGEPLLVGLIDEAHAAVRLALARWERVELVDDEGRALFETMCAVRRKLDAAKRLASGEVGEGLEDAHRARGRRRFLEDAEDAGELEAARAFAEEYDRRGAIEGHSAAERWRLAYEDAFLAREAPPPPCLPSSPDAEDVARAAFVLETRGPWAGRPADGRWYPAVAGTWNQTGWDDERASTFECQRQASVIMAQMATEAAEVEFRVRRVELPTREAEAVG